MSASKKKVYVAVLGLLLVLFTIAITLILWQIKCRKEVCVLVFDRYSYRLIRINNNNFEKFLDIFGTGSRDQTLDIYQDFWPEEGMPQVDHIPLRPVLVSLALNDQSSGSGFPLLGTLDGSAFVSTMTTKVKPLYVKLNINIADYPPVLSIDGQEYQNAQVTLTNALSLVLFNTRNHFSTFNPLDQRAVFSLMEMPK